MDLSQLVAKILEPLGNIWKIVIGAIRQFLYRFRFLFIWLFLAMIAVYLTARLTYWYKAIYEPAQELKANPPISIEKILESLDVTLGDFSMPKGLGSTHLNSSFFFSLSPAETWDDENISKLWIPAGEMGLERISEESDRTIAEIVLELPE